MEKKVSNIYKKASGEISEKWNEYMRSHESKVTSAHSDLLDALASGDKQAIREARAVYERTVKNVTLNNERFKAMVDETTAKLAHTNEVALDYVNGNMAKVYTLNYNAFSNQDISGYTFTLVNEQAVKNLAKENKSLLPAKKIDIPKDKAWNIKSINSEVLQGILQGENIPKIAKRLTHVTDMNRKSSIRNARTMVTSAENKGRQDSFKKAESDGVIMKRKWVAAIDDRTRAWHSDLDGVEVDIDKPWENDYGEIMYPGDPTADPANVYNCRCSIRAVVKGFKWDIKDSEGDLTEVKSINPELFKDSKTKSGQYAYQLAKDTGEVRYEEEHTFTLIKGNDVAFANIWEDKGELEITTMGSTGGGAGTDIFISMMERAKEKGLAFTWLADHKSAMNYYSKLGLDSYIEKKYSDSTHRRYRISSSELEGLIKKLRGRK